MEVCFLTNEEALEYIINQNREYIARKYKNTWKTFKRLITVGGTVTFADIDDAYRFYIVRIKLPPGC
jgi:hypothetical protein